MDINEFLKPLSVEFIPSYTDSEHVLTGVYFLCHIHKCGGLDFEIGLRNAFMSVKHDAYQEPGYALGAGRLDSHELCHTFRKERAGQDFEKFLGLYSSHQGIPAYELCQMPESVHRLTFLREPLERSLSHYNYQCMRSTQLPDIEGFIAFYREFANPMCRTLDPYATVDALIKYIRERFFICCDLKYISSSIAHILTRHQLSNVIKGRLNKTLGQYKLSRDCLTEKQIRAFREFNTDDYILYQHFKHEPKIVSPYMGTRIADYTSLVVHSQREEKFSSSQYDVQTQHFLNFLCHLDLKTTTFDEVVSYYTKQVNVLFA